MPFQEDDFTYTPDLVATTIQTMIDLNGEFGEVIRQLNMPPSYVILDRVVWGVSALLGRLGAHGNFRALLAEYRKGDPPSTELGRAEAEWHERQTTAAP